MKNSKKDSRAGAITLVSGIVLLLILHSLLEQWSPYGGGRSDFEVYIGPALPMAAISGGEHLDVARHVDFDFSPYAGENTEVVLTDSYRLVNPSDDALTVELAYPFQGALIDEERFFPAITVNGAAIEAALYSSIDAKGLLSQAENWETYRTAMLEHDYLAEALADVPVIDTPVTVYKISGLQDQSSPELTNKYLTITYTPDPGASIWSYHCADNENKDGSHFITLDVPEADWQWGVCYLLVRGGELHDFSQQGHHTTFPPKEGNQVEGISATVERFESTFGEMVLELADHYSTAPQYDDRFERNPYGTPETLYRGAMARIRNGDYHKFSTKNQILDEVFFGVLSEEVLLYDVFSVTMAPGETVWVDVTYHQSASRDHGGLQSASQGYDMATQLGSSLLFHTQSASLTNGSLIRILEQNFGFDLESGIVSVGLNPEVERYYLRVASAS